MNEDAPKKPAEKYEPQIEKVVKPDRQLFFARFSRCGSFIVGGGYDALVRRWDVAGDGQEAAELEPLAGHNGWVGGVALHPDGQQMFTSDSWGQIRCWPHVAVPREPLWKIEQAHEGWVRALAVSPDGGLLASCGADQAVRIWRSEDGEKLHELTGHGEDVFCVQFHPDGKSLVSADHKGIVKQWDLATGEANREFDASVLYAYHRIQEVGGVRTMTFDPEGKTLLCGGVQPKNGGNVTGDPTLLLFDWESGKLRDTWILGKTNDAFVFDVAVRRDGLVMAVTSGQPGTGKLIFRRYQDDAPFFEHTRLPNCHGVSLHPDGSRLAVASTNGGSNGNGRRLTKDGVYAGNHSPIHIFALPEVAES